MREIKFRGYTEDYPNEGWVRGDLVQCQGYPVIVNSYCDQFRCEEESVGQYTGMKDKNGVEIFEGDIVKMYCSFKDIYGTSLETHEDEITIIGVVRIDMTTGMYLEVDDETENYYWHEFYRDPAEHFEIIGNIYENPELMAQTND